MGILKMRVLRVMLKVFTFWFLLNVSAGLAAQTRSVKDAEGTMVQVPPQALRVVALSEIDLDICLALGVTPVGTISGRGQSSHPHYLKAAENGISVSTIPIVGDLGRPSVEAVVKLKPDLILTSQLRPETLALLRKIAPTVVTHKNGEHWKDVLTRVAGFLGKEAKEKEFLASYEKEVASAKSRIEKTPGKTVSIVRWNPTGPAFMYQDSFASLVLRELGLTRPKPQQIAGQKHSMPISLEALDMIDADWLFIGTLDQGGAAADAMRDIAANPSFQRLSSVKARRFHAVDGSKWTSVGGPLAALSIVRETTGMIAGGK